MSSSKSVPDAWDDDWVDNPTDEGKDTTAEQEQPKKLSKAERRRQQYELNKKLWEEAEAPETPYFVQRTNDVPLQSGFAPQMKVLSRKPVTLARKDPATGMQQLNLQDGDEPDEEEEEERRKAALSAEGRAERAKQEREEKQRKYDEVRQRLFGSDSGEASASSTKQNTGGRGGPGNYPQQQTSDRGGRGRGRGNAGSARSSPGKQLYDPNAPSKSTSASSSGTATPVGDAPIRAPRGPDGSGKGGRGFTQGRGRGTST